MTSEDLRALIREVIREVLRDQPANAPANAPASVSMAPTIPLGRVDGANDTPTTATPATSAAPGPGTRRVERGAVTERMVREAVAAGERRIVLGRGAVLTPLARDRARASGVEIVKEQ